jgi:hypothetical protein
LLGEISREDKRIGPSSRQERQVLKKMKIPSSLLFLGGLAVKNDSLRMLP